MKRPLSQMVATDVPAVHDEAVPPPAREFAAAVARLIAMPSVGHRPKAGSHGVLANRHSDSTVAFASARESVAFTVPLTCSDTVPDPIGVPSLRTTWKVWTATFLVPPIFGMVMWFA